MPIYEYRCQECGKEFEKLVRSFSSASDIECPHCGGKKVKKAFSLFGTRSSGSGSLSAGTCAPGG
ncbi:MAG TPA: zinc ribbon domain-containing protein [Anaerolineae bacterium]|nr:zinc ribbon domain-containing protein [Anaerolineae bacterium]